MVLAVEPGIYWEGGSGLQARGQFLDHRLRSREAVALPGRSRAVIWAGSLNRPHEIDAQVGFYDTTLRDGEQTVGMSYRRPTTSSRSRALSDAGVERIEAGFLRVSEDDYRAVQLIAGAGRRPRSGFRARYEQMKALVELGVEASVIESPISI